MTAALALEEVAASLGRHIPLYRRRPPHYQTVMLNDLRALWQGQHERLLDVGGGTGVIAQALKELFPVGCVEAIDVEDRYLEGLTVGTRTFDGCHIPFADESFDSATINNVLHHVPVESRPALLKEVRRVVSGPVYIKDHSTTGRVDDLRLGLLDLMGNLPFSGMVSARYLGQAEWDSLAATAGYRIAATRCGAYRSGLFAALFPNRLEIAMRWEPIS